MNLQISRTKDLLKTSRHASMATVNEDGSPHNTPYFFVHSPDLTKLYWISHPETMHAKNIARTGQLFVVLFHNNDHAAGIYFRAHNGRVAEGKEFTDAVAAVHVATKKAGYQHFTAEAYAAAPTNIYVADIQQIWVNGFEQDESGMVVRDYRTTVTAQDLLQ